MKVFRVIIKERTCSKAEDFPLCENKHDKELFMPANNIEQIWDYFRSRYIEVKSVELAYAIWSA